MDRPNSSGSENKSGSRRKGFRRGDLFLLLAIALGSALLLGFFISRDLGIRDPKLEVSQNGQVLGVYSLSEDREVLIGTKESGGYNLLKIESGRVHITEADCPDRSCTRSLAIDRRGGSIICLPHRLVLRIIDGEGGIPDAVAE